MHTIFIYLFDSAKIRTITGALRAKAHHQDGHCMVAFGTGQPLGFYSSWPLFTLVQHNTVLLVDPESQFTAYAILGAVIGGAEVAAMYQKLVLLLPL